MKFADRMSRLGTETAFEVLAKARALQAQGRSVIELEIGEPDFDTPRHIIEAMKQALDSGYTHYSPSAGLPDLRKAIAHDAGKRRGIELDSDMVVVTPGAKPIMFFTIMALVNEGDEVIYPNPGFPIYESVINFVGAKPVPIRLREELDFVFDVDELAALITPKTKLLILNSPQNPTGGVLTAEDVRRVADLAKQHDLWVLSDEVYLNILYEGKFETLTAIDGMLERTIILDGFSKTYAMTGWRVGYGIMPHELAAGVARLQTNSNSCTNTAVQRACIAAISGPQDDVHTMVAEFKRRRDVIVDGLNDLPGVSCRRPRGAFYVFPNITETGKDSRFLEDYFLQEAGVATLSGTSFGKFGEGYLRLSYAASIQNIEEALRRMRAALEKL
ncbi:MAG: pyridoxal phosphate-dependent aminotransferase [Candidatus Alcyoniella australis]|nr:pyridoxal phosphate-dependent aminotransferase [Candidatus Alcyoniella australis]